LNHFTHGRFGLDRQSITRDVCTPKESAFSIFCFHFSLLIPGTPYIRSSEILSKYLVASSKHFWLPNYASVHHLQIILKERLNPYAKAVNFTFDNSNIRSDKSSGLASSVISGFHPPHNFHKRNQLEN
jgi:hypothetical protein